MINSKHGNSFNWSSFIVLNNQWGRQNANNNSYQYLTKSNDNSITLSYKWNGNPNSIKSFPSICSGWHFGNPGGWLTDKKFNKLPSKLDLNKDYNVSISVLHENKGTFPEIMNLTWDIWLSDIIDPDIPSGEIMVWPWKIEQLPIGSLISNITFWKYTWEVYLGYSSYEDKTWPVVSFVCQTPTLIINGNLKDFFGYCINKKFFKPNYYILGIELGNEILSGEGIFKYNYYNLDY
ncbi:MAG: hypothetical protein ABF289_12330 [Clostridiales bacterium]